MDPRKHLLAAATISAALAATGVARAQPHPAPHPAQPATTATPLVEARRAYDEGTAQYAAGHYSEALTSFLRAYELRPNPVVLVPIIECHRQLGHTADELTTIERYLRDAPNAPTRATLEARRTELRGRPATVHVTTTPPGATVQVDGHDTGRTTPADVEVPAGHHVVTASRAGFTAVERPLDLTAGQHADADVALTTVPTTSVTPVAPVVTATSVVPVVPVVTGPHPAGEAATPPGGGPEVHTGGSGFTAPVIVAAVLAGGFLVGGTVFGVLAYVDSNTYSTSPTRDLYDQGRREALFADVGFIAAAAAAGVGLVVYLSGRGHHEEALPHAAPQAAAPRWMLAPSGVAVTF